MAIRKVGVIGAGVMGAGIAAQVANAGVPVVLLDIVPKGANDRSMVARGAIEKMLKTEPAPFMSARAAKLVEPGNIEDDLGRMAECDWIIEVIVERPDIKRDLYTKLEAVRRPGTAISSNTSTIPLRHLTEGMGEAFKRDFLITHFFNPPRYMRLLEVVPGPQTDPATIQAVSEFADRALGKSIVVCNDAPGFIANRVGNYWLQVAVVEAFDAGMTVEEADAVIGRPFGIPKTGVFGLLDLVGLDLMPHVNASLARTLAPDDAFQAHNREMPLLGRMIEQGMIGRKGKGGFYLFDRATRKKQAIDLQTGEYRPEVVPDLPELEARDLTQVMSAPTKAGRYAWDVMGRTLAYAVSVVPEAAGTLADVDAAMRLGYNWRFGPFELIDKLGTGWFADRLRAEGRPVPKLLEVAAGRPFYRVEDGHKQFLTLEGTYSDVVRAPGVILLEDIKRTSQPLLKNGSASLWDIGDGVVCLEFTSKANSLDEGILSLLTKSIALVKEQFKALVIYNEGQNFSVGANLGTALCCREHRGLERDRKGGAGRAADLQNSEIRPLPDRRGAGRHGAGRRLRDPAARERGAGRMRKAISGWSNVASGCWPGWGGCKEMLVRWSALGQAARRADAGAGEGVRAGEHGHHVQIGGAGEGLSVPAPHRRHHDEPGPAAGGREGEGAVPGGGLQAARAAGHGIAGSLGCAGDEAGGGGLPQARHRHRSRSGRGEDAGRRAVGGRHRPDGYRDRGQDAWRWERAGFMKLIKTAATLARVEHTLVTGKPLRN